MLNTQRECGTYVWPRYEYCTPYIEEGTSYRSTNHNLMSGSDSGRVSNAFWFIEAIILAFAIESFTTGLTEQLIPGPEVSEELAFLVVFLLISITMSVEVYYAPEYALDRSLAGEISSHICLIISVLSLVVISEVLQADQTAAELIDGVSAALILLFAMFFFIRLIDEITAADENKSEIREIIGRDIQNKFIILTPIYITIIAAYFMFFLCDTSNTYLFLSAILVLFFLYYVVAYVILPWKVLNKWSET